MASSQSSPTSSLDMSLFSSSGNLDSTHPEELHLNSLVHSPDAHDGDEALSVVTSSALSDIAPVIPSGFPVYAPWQVVTPAPFTVTPAGPLPALPTTVPSFSAVVPPFPVPVNIQMPNLPAEVEMAIFDLVPIALSDDTALDFLSTRSAILLSCRLHHEWVVNDARWWTRLLVSPRVPLHYVEHSLDLSDLDMLWVGFNATFDPARPLSIAADGSPCTFGDYVDAAAEVLSQDLDRCMQLDVVADSPRILGQVLDPLRWTSPSALTSLLVTFSIDTFEDFLPLAVSTFRFASFPPFGPPFPPFTSLTWSTANVLSPTVTYSMQGQLACTITQPHDRPVSWDDLFPVVTHSPDLHTLVVDGITMDYVPLRLPAASFPIFPLQVLKLTLRGDESLAFLMSRLNLPALRHFTVVLVDDRDVRCLTLCSSILSNIEELVIVGQCTHTAELEVILSLARRIVTLDLLFASSNVFRALHAASGQPAPSGIANFNACPALRTLLLGGVQLHAIRSLMISRRLNNLSKLDNIRATKLGRDVLDVELVWFSGQGVNLSVEQ